MSYSCSISFKQVNAIDAFEFLKEFKEFCLKDENYKAIAKENCHYCPVNRGLKSIPLLQDAPKELIEESKNWVVNGMFKFRYFYDRDRGQIGVYGVPQVAQQLFDGTVYFQNSCDQDYPREEYSGIKVFEDIYDEWFNLDEEEFIEKFESTLHQKFDRDYMDDCAGNDEQYKDAFEYTKRSVIYGLIWDPIAHTLENDDAALYLSFFNSYDILKQYSFISMCHKEHLEWEREFEERHGKPKKEEVKPDVGDAVLDDEER